MNVKLLFFPLAITVTLFLSIFYIKPEIDSAFTNRDKVDAQNKILETAKMKSQNAQTLESSLNENKQTEMLVMKYLPETRDDGRAVDSINFLASQSGLVLETLKLEKISSVASELAEGSDATATEAPAVNLDLGSDAQAEEIKEVAAKAKEVSIVMTVKGSYEGIKDMVSKLSKMDRFQNFSAIDIKRAQDTEGGTGDLSANITMQVAYLPPVKSQGKFNREILEKSAFSFDIVKTLQNQISSPVPPIEMGATGASNPFVR